MGWIIALGILTGLAILPVGVCGKYDRKGVLVRLRIGPVLLTVYPKKKADKKTVTKSPSSDKKTANEKKKEEKQGGSVTEFKPFVKILLELLADFKTKLRVKRLDVLWILAGDDPCDLAVNYGKACAAVGSLLPQLERFLAIRNRDVRVECDFTAQKSTIYAFLDVRIMLARLLTLAVKHGAKALRQYLNIQNKGKGGVKT